ncbi:MAG: hypothetical protein CBD32_07150 [Actinobacteria bacterium TMED172]|nr:TonB-dependent receptor [Cellvibrionales bacterium]OUW32145.1 MAG: hypothetical protein CBD32_07150 [Actinobacteria bacterium TMED172]
MNLSASVKNVSTALGLTIYMCSISGHTFAQEIEEITVQAVKDFYSIMPEENSESAFGLSKSLAETPRSVTEVRADLVEKFVLRSVDDLVRLTPGAFTSSFFGIKGAMDIRGEPADNYFRGFRRIANPGAFNTIVRGAEKLEIMRGPVSPLYGSGSVGGQLNYTPKSSKVKGDKYIDEITGGASLTVGSYQQQIISGNLGAPFMLGDKEAGVHIFAELEDSESFFDGYYPSSFLLQTAFDIDWSDETKVEFGFQYQTSDSIQVPGWTRVTQDLIDDGTYITGAPQVLNDPTDLIGFNTLTPQESAFITPAAAGFLNNAFSNTGSFCMPPDLPWTGPQNAQYNGQNLFCPGGFGNWLSDPVNNTNPFQLTNVGTAQLEHDTTFIDTVDYADTTAFTAYLDITHDLDNGMIWKNEIFYDYLEHTKYQSWGFTAFYPEVDTFELRSSLTFSLDSGAWTSENIVGANYRYEDLEMWHAWFDETFDFRDMTVGPTPNDRISPATFDPYSAGATLTYDANGDVDGVNGTLLRNFNEVHLSTNENIGVFAMSDISIDKFNILLGARYDIFNVESEDGWVTYLDQPQGTGVIDGDEDAFSYNVSVSYTDQGFSPYVTYAESNSLSPNQVGGIIPATVENGEFVQESELAEVGIKYQNDFLYAALSYYDQEKTFRDDQTNALVAVYGDGVELEVRALINDNFSILGTVSSSDTTEVCDGCLAIINSAAFADQNGLTPDQVYGGRIGGDRVTFVPSGTELDRGGLPDLVASLYATYTTYFEESELTSSLGFTYVDEAYNDVFETILMPSYTIVNGSISYSKNGLTALLQANNLLDEEYYTNADLFDSVVIKPSEGRTLSFMLSYDF